MKTGTLKELNVKPGDVVECVCSSANTECGAQYIVNEHRDIEHYREGSTNASKFRIISRADDTSTLWRDMTPEEKGALLLARHEGKEIEHFDEHWRDCGSPYWFQGIAYRIKPQPRVEVVTLYFGGWGFASAEGPEHATHSITFNKTEGKPDPASIKMEEL